MGFNSAFKGLIVVDVWAQESVWNFGVMKNQEPCWTFKRPL